MKLTPLIAAAVVLFTLGGDARPADPPKRATGPQPETETDLIQRGISICGRSGGQRGLIPQGDEGAVDGYRRTVEAKFIWYTMTKTEPLKQHEKEMLAWAIEATCAQHKTYTTYCPCFYNMLSHTRRNRAYPWIKMMKSDRTYT